MPISRMTKPTEPRMPPLSVRLSRERLAALDKMRGSLSRNAFVTERLFGKDGGFRPVPKQKVELAQILALLGHTGLRQTIKELSDAVRTGSLPVTPETDAEIKRLADASDEILRLLLKALQIRSGE